MENRVMELIEKEMLTVDEVHELEESTDVEYFEDCGMSGRYNGWHWETITVDGEEYDIYYK